jgi:hypothetical protein
MTGSKFTARLAQLQDLDLLQSLMDAAITELQKPYLSAAQIESSRSIMGLDTQLVEDGTYFIVECAGATAEGFRRIELMATMAGQPLYRACGYEPVESVDDNRGGAPVPLLRMQKQL